MGSLKFPVVLGFSRFPLISGPWSLDRPINPESLLGSGEPVSNQAVSTQVLRLRGRGAALIVERMADGNFRLAHGLNAVLGWLELGNVKEARAELAALPKEFCNDTDVLDVQWLLHARDEDREGALEVAERLLKADPDCSSGWLHRAYALRRTPQGGLAQAAEALRPAAEKFPAESTIPFNLACYACQLGQMAEARHWLREAFRRGDPGQIKAMALADGDLEALWPEIKTW